MKTELGYSVIKHTGSPNFCAMRDIRFVLMEHAHVGVMFTNIAGATSASTGPCWMTLDTDSRRASIACTTAGVRNLLTMRMDLGGFSSWRSFLLRRASQTLEAKEVE